jgi:hypothetical protein
MSKEGSPTSVTYPQFTNKALNEGMFDQLMVAVEAHIHKEFKAQRITGDTYSKVYLGALEAVLGASTQYLLGLLLIEEQQAKLQAETDLIEAQIELTEKQQDKIDKELDYIAAKILTELANTDETVGDDGSLVGRQRSLLHAQKLGFAGDLQSKAAKVFADYDAVYQTVQEVPEAATLGTQAVDALVEALGIATTIESV